MENAPMSSPTPAPIPPKKGYGKRPLWQWIALYVVIGGAIYWTVYYFAYAKSNSYSNDNTNTSQGLY